MFLRALLLTTVYSVCTASSSSFQSEFKNYYIVLSTWDNTDGPDLLEDIIGAINNIADNCFSPLCHAADTGESYMCGGSDDDIGTVNTCINSQLATAQLTDSELVINLSAMSTSSEAAAECAEYSAEEGNDFDCFNPHFCTCGAQQTASFCTMSVIPQQIKINSTSGSDNYSGTTTTSRTGTLTGNVVASESAKSNSANSGSFFTEVLRLIFSVVLTGLVQLI